MAEPGSGQGSHLWWKLRGWGEKEVIKSNDKNDPPPTHTHTKVAHTGTIVGGMENCSVHYGKSVRTLDFIAAISFIKKQTKLVCKETGDVYRHSKNELNVKFKQIKMSWLTLIIYSLEIKQFMVLYLS